MTAVALPSNEETLAHLATVPIEILRAAKEQRSDYARRSVLASYALMSLGCAGPLDLHPDDFGRLLGGMAVADGMPWVDRYYGAVMAAEDSADDAAERLPSLCRVGICNHDEHERLDLTVSGRFSPFPLCSLHPAALAEHLVSPEEFRADLHHRLISERYAVALNRPGRNVLVIEVAAQVGKSTVVSEWGSLWGLVVGAHSELHGPGPSIIATSYSAELIASKARIVRNRLAEHGELLNVPLSDDYAARADFALAAGGGMVAAASDGPVTGRPASLCFLVDDPLKGWASARSKTQRGKVIDAYRGSGVSRLGPNTTRCLVTTRWHPDDLAGHIRQTEDPDHLEVLTLPGVAEADDPLGREPGDPLWPERRDASFYADLRKSMGATIYTAVVQQRPVLGTGGMMDVDKIGRAPALPAGCTLVRYWDLAASPDPTADQTAGVMMGRARDGRWFIVSVIAVRRDSAGVEELIATIAERDAAKFGNVVQVIEEEPGASGKGWAATIVRQLAGFNVVTERPIRDKGERCRPLSAQINAGNVQIVTRPDGTDPAWVADLLEQAAGIGDDGSISTKHDDLIDACSGTFLVAARQPVRKKARISSAAGMRLPA